MPKPFKTLTDKMSPERRARSEERASRMLLELDLQILRQNCTDLTQEDVASLLHVTQAYVSKFAIRRCGATKSQQEARKQYLKLTGTKVSKERIAAIQAQWPGEMIKGLKGAEPKLTGVAAIANLAYVVDANASGADSLFVYIILKKGRQLSMLMKLNIESRMRDVIRSTIDYDVYFRWRMVGEHQDGSRQKAARDKRRHPKKKVLSKA